MSIVTMKRRTRKYELFHEDRTIEELFYIAVRIFPYFSVLAMDNAQGKPCTQLRPHD
jgi:hypothetical protein